MSRIVARLGEDASFTHGTAAPAAVTGVFLAPYAVLPGGFDAGFESSLPRFAAMGTALPSVVQGDLITRGTINWTVVAVEPDDPSGVTVLALRRGTA